MLKHIGRHGEKKVVVAYNTVPGEDHMCLVIYSDVLPSMAHDEIMKVLESPAGQGSRDLAEALHRNIMPDGNNTLLYLHQNGFLKKVQTKQVILTPNPKTSVRLDEINKLLKEMEKGKDAVKKLADIDSNRGFSDPDKTTSKDVGEPNISQKKVNTNAGLTDEDLRSDLLSQAARMESEAKSLIAEARRLKEEAKQFTSTKVTNVRTTKKTTKQTG